MRVSILALALAGLCAPGAALAQDAGLTGEPMTTTPGVSCGSGSTADCEIKRTNDGTDSLGIGDTTGSGTLGNTRPGSSSSGSLESDALGNDTLDSAGTLHGTTPGASGGSSLGTGTTGASDSSGTLIPTTPDDSLGSATSGGGTGGSDGGGSLGGSSGGSSGGGL